jgi:phage-related protein
MNFLALVSWASNAIDGQIAALVVWVTAGFNTMFGDISATNALLGGLGDAVHSVFSTLWTWITNLWQWFHDHIIQKLQDLIDKIKDKLKKIFGPLLCHLRQQIDAYKKLWNQYVKPIIDFLQRVRMAILIFRLLGFKWAKKLDQRIVALENAITNSFLGVLANLNRLADWLNYIIDPFGIFQPSIWFGSISQSVGAIVNLVLGRMIDPLAVTGKTSYVIPAGYLTQSAINARMAARRATGLLPEDQAIDDSLKAAARTLGYVG